MTRLRHLAWAALAVLGLCPLPALAQLQGEDHERAVDFILANARHVLYHEIGHLYVDLLDLPVLGKEEDAVDMLATLTMLADRTNDPVAALTDTADGWLYSERTRGTDYAESDFSGQHSLDIQRSYTITCLMVGSDFNSNSRIATRFGLSIDRQKLCEEEYILARESWEDVLRPFRRNGAPGPGIEVRYAAAGDYADAAEMLRSHRVLEEAADWVMKSYILPQDARFVADVCGEVNAYYVPETREVILCYEWVDFHYALFADHVLPARREAERRRELKLVKIDIP